ncbi:MAG: class I SAM-dependent methyltransferase [Streptococcaceae bacterium]|nr:class I SAM-dependent methyltransferase [Streptococcaceae bacterium]
MSSNQYFENTPDTKHDYKEFTFELRGNKLIFQTDSNVFSKSTIDFGSRVLIDAFDDEKIIDGDVLDVGAGYGPIGLSIAKSTGRTVDMVDVNERALDLARKNAERNLINNVNIYTSSIYDGVEKTDYAAILSNPPIRAGKNVVHEILLKAYEHLKPGGALLIVIQKKQGGPSAKAKMEEIFGNVEVLTKEKGYFIFQSIR